ncbi:transferrin-binding protein-like solute binding protein [Proteus vulgaris]|uniref:Slam-dependent surface lipoprotein n=1 Tax=Proteus vulgaris TaxID=585 RepID=UPI0018E422A6|nr:Slam-dependent surface lipoprotein [Proteus vulgaris]MBI6528289.1 transferrin-binding protein-like solute binding protein [Proteus vulgaris]
MKKLNKITCALFVLMGTHAVHAEIHSNQSGPFTTMKVGASDAVNQGPHQSAGGEPGVGVSTVGGGKKIGFASLTSPMMSGGADSNGIYTIQPNESTPASHSDMGVFHFAKITDANVYFGDWAKTTSATDATHQTYYVGKDVTTTLPTDSATYTVIGVSQYSGNNLLSGTFDVDFSQKKIEGSLVNSQRTVELESGNLYTANNQVTFSADAKEGTTSGIVEGAFFGESAEGLAGIVVFSSDHTKDIGFGGIKDSSGNEETIVSTDAS